VAIGIDHQEEEFGTEDGIIPKPVKPVAEQVLRRKLKWPEIQGRTIL
jgi:hypothetical protein